MKASLFTKIALAAAATIVTLTPAMAGRYDRGHSNHIERKYEHHHGKHYSKKPYWKRGHATKKKWWGPRYSWAHRHHHHRNWR